MQLFIFIIIINMMSAECGRWSMPRWGKGQSVGPKQNIITPALQELASPPSKGKWKKAGEIVTVAGKGGMAFAGTGTLFAGIAALVETFRGQPTTTTTYYSEAQVNF